MKKAKQKAKCDNTMLILYHRDLDGLASGLIAHKYFTEECRDIGEVRMKSIQYGDPFDMKHELQGIGHLVLLDYSFDEKTMHKIRDLVGFFTWIDHHRSAEKLSMWSSEIEGVRKIGESACELTWSYFYGDIFAFRYDTVSSPIPNSISYIGDYDLWKFQYGDETVAYIEYLRQFDIDDDVQQLSACILKDSVSTTNYVVRECIKEGHRLVAYRKGMVKRLFKMGHIEVWEGFNAFVCNTAQHHAFLADYALEQLPDIDLTYLYHTVWNGKEWIEICSLVSRGNVDVSVLAEKFGGGGHEKASGFDYKVKSGVVCKKR